MLKSRPSTDKHGNIVERTPEEEEESYRRGMEKTKFFEEHPELIPYDMRAENDD